MEKQKWKVVGILEYVGVQKDFVLFTWTDTQN